MIIPSGINFSLENWWITAIGVGLSKASSQAMDFTLRLKWENRIMELKPHPSLIGAVMDKFLVARHEAGHAVAIWFVRLEIRALWMEFEGMEVVRAQAESPWTSLETLSKLRRRLLVVFAGNASTLKKWPEIYNNEGDWHDAKHSMGVYFGNRVLYSDAGSDKPFRDNDVNDMLYSARDLSADFVEHPLIRNAIDQLAERFVNVEPSAEGKVWLPGSEVVEICEAVIGKEFQDNNPWSSWLAGE